MLRKFHKIMVLWIFDCSICKSICSKFITISIAIPVHTDIVENTQKQTTKIMHIDKNKYYENIKF